MLTSCHYRSSQFCDQEGFFRTYQLRRMPVHSTFPPPGKHEWPDKLPRPKIPPVIHCWTQIFVHLSISCVLRLSLVLRQNNDDVDFRLVRDPESVLPEWVSDADGRLVYVCCRSDRGVRVLLELSRANEGRGSKWVVSGGEGNSPSFPSLRPLRGT